MTNIELLENEVESVKLTPDEMVEQTIADAMKVPGYLLENRENAVNTALEHCRVVNDLFSSFGPVSTMFTNPLKSMIKNMIHETVYPIKGGFKLKIKGKKILKIRKKTQFKKRDRYAIF